MAAQLEKDMRDQEAGANIIVNIGHLTSAMEAVQVVVSWCPCNECHLINLDMDKISVRTADPNGTGQYFTHDKRCMNALP